MTKRNLKRGQHLLGSCRVLTAARAVNRAELGIDPIMPSARRAQGLKIDFLVQRRGSKVEAIERLLARTGLEWADLGYVSEGLVDLEQTRLASVGVAAANAIADANAAADYVTRRAGVTVRCGK